MIRDDITRRSDFGRVWVSKRSVLIEEACAPTYKSLERCCQILPRYLQKDRRKIRDLPNNVSGYLESLEKDIGQQTSRNDWAWASQKYWA